jgi:hypothetical protein
VQRFASSRRRRRTAAAAPFGCHVCCIEALLRVAYLLLFVYAV